jgi:hypothetical protein
VSSTTDKSVINLLVNDDFINYVINPNLILVEMWKEFFDAHPDMIPVAEEAKAILLGQIISDPIPLQLQQELETTILQKCGLTID